MRTRFLLLTALAAWVAGAAHAWPTLPPRYDTARPSPALDQLIDQLAEVRAKEAELQARRADLERQLRDRLAEQARRLQQVGVAPAAMEQPGFVPGDVVPSVLPFPTVAPPTPAVPIRKFSSTFDDSDAQPGLSLGGELQDRFDALGGLPLAHTRWWRDYAPRRSSEGFFPHYSGLFGGN